MNLEIIIEKINDDVVVPLENSTGLQIRHDGIMLDGRLHFWEEIMFVQITNRGLLQQLKHKKK